MHRLNSYYRSLNPFYPTTWSGGRFRLRHTKYYDWRHRVYTADTECWSITTVDRHYHERLRAKRQTVESFNLATDKILTAGWPPSCYNRRFFWLTNSTISTPDADSSESRVAYGRRFHDFKMLPCDTAAAPWYHQNSDSTARWYVCHEHSEP